MDRYDAGCGNTPPDAHGTGMTGAIASRRNLLGVAPNVKVIAICAFGGETAGESTSIKIIKGLDYAISQGARIINMSFAGPRDPVLAQALQIAREKGVVLIGAAGNAGPKSPPLMRAPIQTSSPSRRPTTRIISPGAPIRASTSRWRRRASIFSCRRRTRVCNSPPAPRSQPRT